jgi:sugar/nucleoside kinase (ribokinase family)
LGFTDIVLTDAANPLTVMQSGELTTIDVPECNIMGTVNGAGDAMAGATLAHYCHNGDLVRSMKEAGIIAARCVLEGTPIRYPAPTTIIHSPLNT